MKNLLIILALLTTIALIFYFIGKRNGESEVKTGIVQNVALVKEIAQMASLEVSGTTTIKITNKGEGTAAWNKLKNYFAENTLQVSVPYEAKYGVDMQNQQMEIDTKASTATIYLPQVKMLSMQLRLDKLESMQQTGIFGSISVDQFVKAQKEMYASANSTLENNAGFIKMAEENIIKILRRYYSLLGYEVSVKFGQAKDVNRKG